MRRKIHTEIEIDADGAAVWQVLTDFERFREWNSLMPKVRGLAAVGSVVWFRFHLNWPIRMLMRARVTKASAGAELRWVGILLFAGLFRGEHYFVLQPGEGGGTRFRHGEELSGALVLLLWPLIGAAMQRAYAAMNVELKARVEGAAR